MFERAELLGVEVTDLGGKPERDSAGDLVFPKMTREQVRDRLGSGMDFELVLRTTVEAGFLEVADQVSVGIREVEIE